MKNVYLSLGKLVSSFFFSSIVCMWNDYRLVDLSFLFFMMVLLCLKNIVHICVKVLTYKKTTSINKVFGFLFKFVRKEYVCCSRDERMALCTYRLRHCFICELCSVGIASADHRELGKRTTMTSREKKTFPYISDVLFC